MRFSDVVELDIDVLKAEAPGVPGIYEIGYWVEPHFFVPRYVGRARGNLKDPDARGTSIRSRLLKHASGRGNKGVKAALEGNLEEYWLEDPDDLTEHGAQLMKVHDSLWCRWIAAKTGELAAAAAEWEASLLQNYYYGKGHQYVWNRRL